MTSPKSPEKETMTVRLRGGPRDGESVDTFGGPELRFRHSIRIALADAVTIYPTDIFDDDLVYRAADGDASTFEFVMPSRDGHAAGAAQFRAIMEAAVAPADRPAHWDYVFGELEGLMADIAAKAR